MFISCSECSASEQADKPGGYTEKGCLRDCASIPCILYVRMLYPPQSNQNTHCRSNGGCGSILFLSYHLCQYAAVSRPRAAKLQINAEFDKDFPSFLQQLFQLFEAGTKDLAIIADRCIFARRIIADRCISAQKIIADRCRLWTGKCMINC